MYPYQSQLVVTVLLGVCLASLPQQEGQRRRYIEKLLGEEARALTRVGLVLLVENNSGFSLADQRLYLDDGGQGSWYVLPVQWTILNISKIVHRFGQINKVRPYTREIFFFHNLCHNCEDSSGVLSWTVSRQRNFFLLHFFISQVYTDDGHTPHWVRKGSRLASRVHVMWDIRHDRCGEKTGNTLKLWIQKHALMRKAVSKWILKTDRSEEFFSDFLSRTLGEDTSQVQKHNNLSVKVSVEPGCLPLAWINISNLTPDNLSANQKQLSGPSNSTSTSASATDGSGLKLYLLIPTTLVGLFILIIAIVIILKVRHFANPRSSIDYPYFRLTTRKKRTS